MLHYDTSAMEERGRLPGSTQDCHPCGYGTRTVNSLFSKNPPGAISREPKPLSIVVMERHCILIDNGNMKLKAFNGNIIRPAPGMRPCWLARRSFLTPFHHLAGAKPNMLGQRDLGRYRYIIAIGHIASPISKTARRITKTPALGSVGPAPRSAIC